MSTVTSPDRSEPHRLHPVAGRDGQLARLGPALVDEEAGEDPDAVAAHLDGRAVGVAVVHEPLGVAGHRRGRGIRGCPDDPQHAVAADAGATVAEPLDALVGEVERAVGVGQQHEVVLRAVPLDEPGHASRLRRRGSATRPAAGHQPGRQRRPSHRRGAPARRPRASAPSSASSMAVAAPISPGAGGRTNVCPSAARPGSVERRPRPARPPCCAGWPAAPRPPRGRDIPKSRRLTSTCRTVVMMVDPPGEPTARTGRPSSRTIVGAIDERGRLPGAGQVGVARHRRRRS